MALGVEHRFDASLILNHSHPCIVLTNVLLRIIGGAFPVGDGH